uniref:phage tail tape measure protein n=1 Tax=Enterocloster clostridioformis TaxID=1531 RepID=UPI0025A53C47|nr:phage tail tape measure protein [Enterocloster clostridioformis]
MANRIKGITVEIGGDTTGLDKALKSVNSSIKTTQSSLRDVNRLLKLDPKNTELLSQKQKLLKDAIGQTKEKLDSLKTAQEQAKQQLESGDLGQDKYDALQREIVETEQELKRLQQEAENCNSALSRIDEVGQKMESVGNDIAGAGKKMMPVTLAIGGVGVAAVKTAADFDSAMSQVAAVSGATGDDFDALREKAREMGSKTKFSASEAAEAMNYMAMAGWKTEDMLDGIEGIMNLAAASGEDLATTSDIVTDALTAFGLSAKDSGHFADILAAASSNANTNVSMMGETFKYCAPIAGAMGYSAEDTAQAIGLMANSGIKGSQAGTALRTIMTKLQGDLKLSGAAFGDMTIQTANADGSMRDLNDILADCRVAFSQMTESEKAQAAETLVGKNAMSGFLALMNAAPEDISKLESAIDNCNGTSEEMAGIMQDNLSGQLTILKSQLEELAISFGDILMPAIRNIVSKVQAFIDKLNGMDDGQRKVIIRIALLVAAIGPLLVIIGTAISKVGMAMQGFVKLAGAVGKMKTAMSAGTGIMGKLGAAIGGISAPVLVIIGVIALLVAAFVHLWQTNEEFREKVTAIWNHVREVFAGFVEGVKERLAALGIDFEDVASTLKAIWEGFCAVLAPVFEGAFQVIATVLETVLGVITGLLDVFIGIFTGNWDQAWTGVKEIFSSIWEGIKGIFTAVTGTLKGILDVFLGWFGTSWDELWSGIKSFFEGVWNGIVTFITGVLNGIKAFFTTIWNAIKTVVTTVVNAIKTTITTVWNGIKATITTVLNGIKATVTTVWNGIKSTITTVVGGIKTGISTAFNAVKTTVSSIFNGIKSTATSVWNGIKTAITTPINAARDAVKGAIDRIKGFFNFSWSLPHLKLPHLSITGSFSLVPPSVPHFSIQWYKEGGIMTRPTLFGMNGSSLMAGGEAGAEAILPLKGFYDQLSAMLDSKLNTSGMEQYLAVIAANSAKDVVLDSGVLVGQLAPGVNRKLGNQRFKAERRMV